MVKTIKRAISPLNYKNLEEDEDTEDSTENIAV
jgi:hypothetical protein